MVVLNYPWDPLHQMARPANRLATNAIMVIPVTWWFLNLGPCARPVRQICPLRVVA